jgi:hypothetical protein
MDVFLIQPYYPLPFGMLDSITTFGLSNHGREIATPGVMVTLPASPHQIHIHHDNNN